MSKIRVAINGFGRIGRITFRQLIKNENIEVVAINDLGDVDNLAHLVRYDTVHGRFDGKIEVDNHGVIVNGHKIKVLQQSNPSELPWKEMQIDIVLESTGNFVAKDDAMRHVKDSGARKVIISAPAKADQDDVKFVVLGINDEIIDKDDVIISNASCTTNCVAPMIKVLDDMWGVEKAFITTVHSFTKDQNIIDGPHKDYRRGRTAAASIVPTTTGAAKAVSRIFPHLKDDLGGCGIRVPVPDGSLTDLTCTLVKPATVEEINAAFKKAAEQEPMKGILEYTEDPIVSVDILGNPYSAVFDAGLTSVLGDKNKLVKIIAWYDNEMGYSCRLVELIEKFA
ncbi:MAG: type I glyceraldehyde-3-phosphate dehydrogenase [Bacteroidota bacterium]|nr:type I glyceraldehyde-3-phosphate dehydrogenase [Bacteroidota bacterium]